MALASWALLTLQDAKEHLSQGTNEFDAVIEGMVESATLLCENECDRLLLSRTYSAEVYDGSGRCDLKLRQYPVTTLTSVETLDTGTISDWTTWSTVTYGGYIVQPLAERIAFRQLVFPRGYQNVRVTYVAGFTTASRSMKDACRIALKALWDVRDKQNAGIASQSFQGGQTVVYDRRALPEMFGRLLAPYQRCAWV